MIFKCEGLPVGPLASESAFVEVSCALQAVNVSANKGGVLVTVHANPAHNHAFEVLDASPDTCSER